MRRWFLAMAASVATLYPGLPARAVPYLLTADGLHRVTGLDLTTGGSDTQLSDSTETLGIWTAIDALTPPPPPGTIAANAKTYNVGAFANGTVASIDYVGGGDFGVNRALSTIGAGFPMAGTVEDVSVRARTYLAVPIGDWSIAIASDDGRRLQLTDAQSGAAGPGGVAGFTTFAASGEQMTLGGAGTNIIGYNATTGHNRSVGTFSVTPAHVEPGTNVALIYLDGFYFERGTGGGSFEISIRNTLDTTFGGSGEGWTLLQNNTFGWTLSSTPISVSLTAPASAFTWDGSTDDWRAGAGADTHWEPPVLGNTLYATLTDDAAVNAGQANVASSNEAALNLSIGGTGTVSVAAGRTLSVDSTLTIGAGGTLANAGAVNALVVNSTGTVTLAAGSSIAASGALGNVDVLSGTPSLSGFLTATTLDLAAGTGLSVGGGSLTAAAVTLAGGTATINTAGGTAARLSNIGESVASNIAYTGAGIVVLPTANTYTGTTTIGPGVTVQLGNNASLGTEAGKTTIQSGGTLDIRGFRAGANGNELIEVEGTGVGGNGAINNTGGSQTSAFRQITLTGPATFRSGVRWDMRDTGGAATFDMGGFTLTKVGAAELCLVNTNILNEGSINVNQAIFRLEGSTRHDGPGTITVASGATLDFYANTQTHGPNLSLQNGSNLTTNGSGGPTLSGTVGITGAANIVANYNLTLNGPVTGGGFAKSGGARLILNNATNSFTGAVAVNAGTLAASGAGSLGNPSGITVASGATLELNNVGAALAIPLTLAGNGVGSVGALNSIAGSTTLTGPLTIAGATITNSAAGTTLTLSGPISLTQLANLAFAGSGDFVVSQPFGNGGVPIAYNQLMAMRFTGDKAATNLDFGAAGAYTVNPNGTISQSSRLLSYAPATVAPHTIAMNMDKDATTTPGPGNGPFHWQAVFGSAAAGDQSNFQVAWTGEFTPDANGNFTFRSHDKDFTGTDVDDDASIFIDVNQNGAFEAGEGFQSGTGGAITANGLIAGQKYRLAIGYREGSGDEEVSFTFQGTAGAFTSETGINPGAPAQAGLFTVSLLPNNSLSKTGAGTLTLQAANTYNGTTTVSQGALIVGHDNALGTTDAGTLVGGGARLVLPGGLNIPAGEALTLGDAAGQGILTSLGAGNTYGGNLTLGGINATLDSQAGLLTLPGTIAMGNSRLTVTGAGDTLIQGAISGTNAAIGPVTPGLLAGTLSGDMSFAANPGNQGVMLSPHAGLTNTSPPWAASTTWVYTGQFYDADGIFSFGENIDDKAWVSIDGVVRLNDTAWNNPTGTGILNLGIGPHGDGWHNIEIRFSNGGGGAGAVAGNGWTITKGFGLNINGTTSNQGTSFNDPVTDPGNATLWRLAAPVALPNDLIKMGAGTLTLNGNNTYVGITDIQQGAVLVNGTTSGQGDYFVRGGALLGGTGAIGLAPGARVNVLADGTVAPGLSPGVLTILGDLVLGEASLPPAVYEWELGAGVEDLLVVTGDLTLNNWILRIVDAGGSTYAWEKHYIFTGFTALSGPNNVTFDLSQVPLWAQFTSDIQLGLDGGGIYLTGLNSTPEPGTLSLLALGGLALLRRRRRNTR